MDEADVIVDKRSMGFPPDRRGGGWRRKHIRQAMEIVFNACLDAAIFLDRNYTLFLPSDHVVPWDTVVKMMMFLETLEPVTATDTIVTPLDKSGDRSSAYLKVGGQWKNIPYKDVKGKEPFPVDAIAGVIMYPTRVIRDFEVRFDSGDGDFWEYTYIERLKSYGVVPYVHGKAPSEHLLGPTE